MREAFDDVLQTSLKYKVDMRTAAYIVAIARVGNGHQDARNVRVIRGDYRRGDPPERNGLSKSKNARCPGSSLESAAPRAIDSLSSSDCAYTFPKYGPVIIASR